MEYKAMGEILIKDKMLTVENTCVVTSFGEEAISITNS